MSRWRITLRNDDPRLELRGYLDLDLDQLQAFAEAMVPYGIVIASPADHDYDPFAERTEAPETVVVTAHDPGGLGFVIERIWAWVAVHDDGDEGVVAAPIGDVTMPLVAADHARLDSLRPIAEAVARASAKPLRLVRFDRRTDVETIER